MPCRLVNCYFHSKWLSILKMCIVCRFISEKWRAPVSKQLLARKSAVDKNIWGHSHTDCGRTLIFSLAWTVQWRLERICTFRHFRRSHDTWNVPQYIYLKVGPFVWGFTIIQRPSTGFLPVLLVWRSLPLSTDACEVIFCSLALHISGKTEVAKFVYTCHKAFVQFLNLLLTATKFY